MRKPLALVIAASLLTLAKEREGVVAPATITSQGKELFWTGERS